MSIRLSVELRRRVHWPNFGDLVSETLKALLALPSRPAIAVETGPLMRQDPSCPFSLAGEPETVSCRISGEPEVVKILPMLEPVQTELPDGSWNIGEAPAAMVFFVGPVTALSWTLWVAVAIALARSADSMVRDFSSWAFEGGDEVAPEELLRALRCSTSEGLQDGAQQVFAKLPASRRY